MHLFTPAVGLKAYATRPAMDKLIKKFINQAIKENKVIFDNVESEDGFCEAQINTTLIQSGKNEIAGISIRGLYNPYTKEFQKNFYFPYIEGEEPYFNIELTMERQTDKEAYMVHCNETKKEVAPIFFLRNIVEYLKAFREQKVISDKMVFLSALSVEGKIILPIKKTEEQIAKCNAATKERNKLVNRALNGDREAMDNLTIGDYDILSDICRRIQKEDIYSIVDSSFIPSGLECDFYSVIGNIIEVDTYQNCITGESVYYMHLECNGYEFDLAINKEDLLGEPQAGFRFVGKIWLQGDVFVD